MSACATMLSHSGGRSGLPRDSAHSRGGEISIGASWSSSAALRNIGEIDETALKGNATKDFFWSEKQKSFEKVSWRLSSFKHSTDARSECIFHHRVPRLSPSLNAMLRANNEPTRPQHLKSTPGGPIKIHYRISNINRCRRQVLV